MVPRKSAHSRLRPGICLPAEVRKPTRRHDRIQTKLISNSALQPGKSIPGWYSFCSYDQLGGAISEDPRLTQDNPHNVQYPEDLPPLPRLDARQIEMIEEALRALGEYGEVRLVVEKGRLRFIVTQKSFDANRWQPGSINQRPG